MIIDFADDDTERLYEGIRPKKLKLPMELHRKALDKLRLLDMAETITDLYIPPSNRLEALQGKRKGQYSIRINDRWRICFSFVHGDAMDVEIIDYH